MEMYNRYGPNYSRAPVKGNSPAEYALRFKARTATKPKVVGFDSDKLLPGNKKKVQVKEFHEGNSRKAHGFFPPVKLRSSLNVPFVPSKTTKRKKYSSEKVCE